MKKILSLAALAALSGCLSSAPKAPVYWTIDVDRDAPAYSAVTVAAPFDRQELAVLRPNGSIAFDSFNAFAARPQQLLRNGIRAGSGPSITVRRLALDCRVKGERTAVVELAVADGAQVKTSVGSSSTRDGDYSRAFTSAFKTALNDLLK